MSQRKYQHSFKSKRTYPAPAFISGIFRIPYLTKNEIQNEDSEESDEEDNDPSLLDFDEMGESDSVRSRTPKEKEVEIKDDHGAIHKCRGRFPLTQIYWKVTVKVSNGWLKSAPQYGIRKDENVRKQNLVIIFLTDCFTNLKVKKEIANAATACFDKFCRVKDCASTLDFTNLEDTLNEYIMQEQRDCFLHPQEGTNRQQQLKGTNGQQRQEGTNRQQLLKGTNGQQRQEGTNGQQRQEGTNEQQLLKGTNDQQQQKNHSSHLQHVMHNSELCAVMLRAASHPTLVETVSSLFPNTFVQFFHKLKKMALPVADEMAAQRPWEFVFRDIICEKLNIHGIEATFSAYENAGYLTRTPQTEKDAIYIYELLKAEARVDGHTYVNFKRLKNSFHFRKLPNRINGEERWENAFEYLENNRIIMREEFNRDMNIFLYCNWKAEVDIVNWLEVILQNHKEEPLRWEIDNSSPDFERIRSDPEQLRALHQIASSPITVLSGMGGCGKTTVITTLLKHICDQVEEHVIYRSEKRLKNHVQTVETDKTKMTDGGRTLNYVSECVDEDLSTSINGPLKPSSLSCITSVCQNPTATDSHSLVNRVIAPPKEHDNSDKNNSSFSVDLCLAEDAMTQKPEPVPSSSHLPILDVDRSLDSVGHNPSGRFQISKHKRIQPQPDNSKEGRLMREAISDLIKIVKLSKDVDHPELEHYKERILLTAPTGKAAKLLGSKANLHSATLHSVVMSWRMYKPGLKGWNYSPVEVLVVDECSLLSVRLFACVINILMKHANLKKIVLLGDMRQLPSIEPGNFLTDVFNAFRSVYKGQECPCLELTSNHRSESSLIIENSRKISHQVMPSFDEGKKFHLVELSDVRDDNERDNAIRYLLNHAEDVHTQEDSQFISFRNTYCQAVNEVCCQHYNHHPIKTAPVGKKKARNDFRIGDKICLGKNAIVSNYVQLMLNKYLECDTDLQEAVGQVILKPKKLNQEQEGRSASPQGSLNRTTLDAAQVVSLFESDDAVVDHTIMEMEKRDRHVEEIKAARAIQEIPAAVHETAEKSSPKTSASYLGEDKEKLCNGEIFFIMDEMEVADAKDNKFVKYLVLSDKDPYCPRVVCVPFEILRKGCKMRHSWARTIHTFQGSECDSVVYVLGQAVPQNWQHVYTAVTRGKKSVYIIGTREELHKAISRKGYPRLSRLRHRLEEMIVMHKRIYLQGFNRDIRNMPTLQDVVESESRVDTVIHEQDFEDSFEDEEGADMFANKKTEDGSCMNVWQGGASSYNNDLNQETHQHRNIQDDFNVFNSLDNNEVNVQNEISVFNRLDYEETSNSDEELLFYINHKDFTSLMETEAPSSSHVNLSQENNVSENLMTDRMTTPSPVKLAAEMMSMFSPNKTALGVSRSPKRTLSQSTSESLSTPPKVRRTDHPLNTPFMKSFNHSLMLEEESSNGQSEESSNVQSSLATKKPRSGPLF